MRKIDFDRDIVMAGMAVFIVLLGLLVGFSLYQQKKIFSQQHEINVVLERSLSNQTMLKKQQKELEFLEKRDRIGSYQAAYRFCTRINVDRAALQALVLQSSKENPDARTRRRLAAYLKKLQSKEGTPVLDCSPNVVGGPAAYQSPAKQLKFVKRWSRGKLTPAEIGICRIRIGEIRDPRACLK